MAGRVNAPVRARFPPPELRPALAYALGVAFPLLSTVVSLAMRPFVYGAPFALYIPAMVFATYLGGLGPGLDRVSDDLEIGSGRGEHVAVDLDRANLGVKDRLAIGGMVADRTQIPQVGEAFAGATQVRDQ